MGNPAKVKRPLGRPRRRWEDIRIGLIKIRWDGVHKIHLAQDRDKWRVLVNTVVVKVKVTLELAMKAQRGSRGIALLFL